MEITIHTGGQGEFNRIHVDWFDHNNVRQTTTVDINVQQQDKPRTLEIVINDVRVVTIPAKAG